MPRILRSLVATGLAGGATGLAYVGYLTNKYPIEKPRAYHKTPEMLASYLDGQGDPEVVYARLRNPSAKQLSNPRDAAIRAFFSAWTLQLEGWLFGNALHCSSPMPTGIPDSLTITKAGKPVKTESFLNGFFQTIHKSQDSYVLFWSFPGRGPPVLHHAAEGEIPQGIQVVSALPAEDGSGDLELAYACAQYRAPYGKEDGPVMSVVHHTYMRYLIERMRANMQAEARRGQ